MAYRVKLSDVEDGTVIPVISVPKYGRCERSPSKDGVG